MPARSDTPTKYVGPEPGKLDADALRRTVPDDPIKLPKGLLACEGCGIAHDGPAILAIPRSRTYVNAKGEAVEKPIAPLEYTRCPDCTRLNDVAGGDERTRNSLYALAVVQVPAPEDPTPLVQWMGTIGGLVSWLNPGEPSAEHCNPYPWAHVSLGHRRKIKEAYLLAMRSRIDIKAAPLDLPPPWGGACLFCGIGTVPMAPLEVARRGGREYAAQMIWQGVTAQAKAFGAKGREILDGFVCPTCAEVGNREVSVSRACAKAFEEHAQRNGIRVPTDLFNLYENGHPVVVPGWASLGRITPNAEPWQHVTLVIEEDEPVPEYVA
ncbi:hypothetical protein F9L07_28235 [Pimelobacter simplex]|uniref:Uncharacterized protein n=1 Tax=Nocardioides simplex TaxID=2045 RepID=A0A7J5DQT4_NOCSI|nr:hypothetical protein [Pimelobacter simplex]KAB2806927.1 hypothetical protein F9L07_28235 [Pimelobacter simplex]